MPKGRNENQWLKVTAIVLAFLSLTALVIFKSGLVHNIFSMEATYDKALIKSVSIQGAIKAKDLNFSPGEIKKINLAALKYQRTFPKVDFHINYAQKEGPQACEPDARLVLNVRLDVEGGGEICSWNREVSRRKMVSDMVEYINRAADELKRYRKIEGAKPDFKRLYI